MDFIKHVEDAIDKAERHESKMSTKAFGVAGLTGAKVRHFLNNLCSGEVNYLEIGSFKGSTLVSALDGNKKARACAIEGFFEEYGGKSGRKYLEQNIQNVLGDDANVALLIGDSFTDECLEGAREFGPYDVFFYDGDHSENKTDIAIRKYSGLMKDEFILVIDDWTFEGLAEGVRAGTFRALAQSNLRIVRDWEIWNQATSQDDNYSGWWFGLYIAVVRKDG